MTYGWTWWFFEVDSASAFAAAFAPSMLPAGTLVLYRTNTFKVEGLLRYPKRLGVREASALFPSARLHHACYNCNTPSRLRFLREAFPSLLTSPPLNVPAQVPLRSVLSQL